jgi:Ran GTPase-activating protein (RanGAP) involved in mRNA processing and transport
MEEDGGQAIGNALGINSSLQELYIGCNRLGPVACQALWDGVAKNHALNVLHMHNSSMCESVDNLSRALTVNTSLQRLVLSLNHLTQHGGVSIAKAMMENVALRHLDVSDNNLADNGAMALCRALIVNNALETLIMSRNNLGAPFAHALALALPYYTTLKHIDLHGNLLTDEGGLAIIEGLAYNKSVQHICLQFNKLGQRVGDEVGTLLRKNQVVRNLGILDYVTSDNEDALFRIGEALRDTPRYHKLSADMHGLNCVADRLGLPEEARRWKNEQIIEYYWSAHWERVQAFAMGLHARAGSASLVQLLSEDTLPLVVAAFFGLSPGAFRAESAL